MNKSKKNERSEGNEIGIAYLSMAEFENSYQANKDKFKNRDEAFRLYVESILGPPEVPWNS
jgi:hypothetical protein